MSFGAAGAAAKPTIACLGHVTKVEDAKKSSSGLYYVVPITIEGYGNSQGTRIWLTFRPEFLRENFNAEELLDLEGGESFYRVYQNNIHQKGSVSTLLGLVGADDERFDALAEILHALPVVNADDYTGQEVLQVSDALRKFLVDEGNGDRVGYVLRQQREKAGVGEDGKPRYILSQYYEVANFFSTDEKNITRIVKKGDTKKFKVRFTENEIPF